MFGGLIIPDFLNQIRQPCFSYTCLSLKCCTVDFLSSLLARRTLRPSPIKFLLPSISSNSLISPVSAAILIPSKSLYF